MAKEHYTYIYLDPTIPSKVEYPDLDMCFLFEPYYAGEGKGTRRGKHLVDAQKSDGKNTRKLERIRELLKTYLVEELKPYIINYIENVSKKTALKNEVKLIDNIGRINVGCGPLTNVMRKGWDMGPEARAKGVKTKKRKGTGKIAGQKGAIARKRNNTLPKGKKNGRAIKLIFISPDGKKYIINGGQFKFCKEHNLTEELLQYKNKGKFPPNSLGRLQKVKNTVGWEVRTID
jgi:hypothetical protein